MTEVKWEKTFAVFTDFLQTMKVFPNKFMSAILSANIYAKGCFCSYQK